MPPILYYPSEALKPFIQYYFLNEYDLPDPPPRNKLFPIPCHHFAFYVQGDVTVYIDGKSFRCEEPTLNGLTTQYFEYELSAYTKFGGISFHPTGFYKLFGIKAGSLKNLFLPLRDYLKDEDYFRKLEKAETAEEFVEAHEKMLLKRLDDLFSVPPIVDQCVADIFANKGEVSIDKLLLRYNCSRRYLEMHFADCVGTSPKKFAKLLRFLLVIRAIEAENANTQTVLSQFNYYDTSHFIKDFEYFLGEKPQSYFKSDHPLMKSMMTNENFDSNLNLD